MKRKILSKQGVGGRFAITWVRLDLIKVRRSTLGIGGRSGKESTASGQAPTYVGFAGVLAKER